MKIVYSLQELTELFSCSRETVRRMEADGRLKRLHQLPGVMYRAKEVHDLVELGQGEKRPTRHEWEQLQSDFADLQEENRNLKKRLERIQSVVLGG